MRLRATWGGLPADTADEVEALLAGRGQLPHRLAGARRSASSPNGEEIPDPGYSLVAAKHPEDERKSETDVDGKEERRAPVDCCQQGHDPAPCYEQLAHDVTGRLPDTLPANLYRVARLGDGPDMTDQYLSVAGCRRAALIPCGAKTRSRTAHLS